MKNSANGTETLSANVGASPQNRTSQNSSLKLALTRVEAAAALGISPATTDRLVKRGLLHPSRATRRPIFSIKELERFLRETSQLIQP